MLNYIRSELYRNSHSKENYLFLIIPMILVIAFNVILYAFLQADKTFPYATTDFAFSTLYTSMYIPLMLTLAFVGIIQGREAKNHTLKNTISFGVSRQSIYLGKALVELIISTIFYVLIAASYIISGLLLLESKKALELSELIRALIGAYPLLLVGGMAAHFLYFIEENETKVTILWSVIMFVMPLFLKLLGKRIGICLTMYECTPLGLMETLGRDEITRMFLMSWSTTEGMIKCFLVGIIGVMLFYILGLRIFEKKEIK